MRPRDWLLLLIGIAAEPPGLDPIRLQKGMFLLAREGGLPPAQRYRFVAYNYGPMSRALYRDVEALLRRGLVERRTAPGYAWSYVAATPAGRARVERLVAEADGGARASVARVAAIRRAVTGMTFAQLLETIYARYPEYAARSVFRRRP